MNRSKKKLQRVEIIVNLFIEKGYARGLLDICPVLQTNAFLLVKVLTALATRPLVIHSQHASFWRQVKGETWDYTGWSERGFIVCTNALLRYCEPHVWLKEAVDFLTKDEFYKVESLQDLPCTLVNAFITTESKPLSFWFVGHVLAPGTSDSAFWHPNNSFGPLLRTTEFLLLYHGDPVLLQNAVHRQTQDDLLAVQEKVSNMATSSMVDTGHDFFHRVENNQSDRILMTFGWYFLCRMLALTKEYLSNDARFNQQDFRKSLFRRIKCVFPFALQALQGRSMAWSFAQVKEILLNEQAAWKACEIAEEFRKFLLNPDKKIMQNRVIWALYDRTANIRDSMSINDKVANTAANDMSNICTYELTEEPSLEMFVRQCLVERGQVEQADVLDEWFRERHGKGGPLVEVCKYAKPKGAFDSKSCSEEAIDECLKDWNKWYVAFRVPERKSNVQRTLISFGLDNKKAFVGMTNDEAFVVLRRTDLISLQTKMVSNMARHEGWWKNRMYPIVQQLMNQPYESLRPDVEKMLVHYAAALLNVKKFKNSYVSMARENQSVEWNLVRHFQTLCHLVSWKQSKLVCEDARQVAAIRSFLMLRSTHYLDVATLEEMCNKCLDPQMQKYIKVLYNNMKVVRTKQVTVYEERQEEDKDNGLARSLSTTGSCKRAAEVIPKTKVVTVLTNPHERMPIEWCTGYGEQLGQGESRVSQPALTAMFYNWIFTCHYDNSIDERTLQRWLLNFTTDVEEKKKFGFSVPDPKNGPFKEWPPIAQHANQFANSTGTCLATLERSLVCGNGISNIEEGQEEHRGRNVWFTVLATGQTFDDPASISYFDLIYNCMSWFNLGECIDEKKRYASWIQLRSSMAHPCFQMPPLHQLVQPGKTPIKPAKSVTSTSVGSIEMQS